MLRLRRSRSARLVVSFCWNFPVRPTEISSGSRCIAPRRSFLLSCVTLIGRVNQEPKTEKDDEYVAKLNQHMNSPPLYSAPNAGGRGNATMFACNMVCVCVRVRVRVRVHECVYMYP